MASTLKSAPLQLQSNGKQDSMLLNRFHGESRSLSSKMEPEGKLEEEHHSHLKPNNERDQKPVPDHENRSIFGKYIKDIVYGGLDGIITTFAIVSGVAGASLSSSIILILGLANILADGFSMAVGNYMGSKAEMELARKERKHQEQKVDIYPELARDEIRSIYRSKGFAGEELERVVEVITASKKTWVDTILVESLGISADEDENPIYGALVTFLAFVVVGSIPLSSYFISYLYPQLATYVSVNASLLHNFEVDSFHIAVLLTMITTFGLGALKSRITDTNFVKSGTEMLFVGSLASLLAYYVGYYLSFIKESL